jgi:hypothetical protein
MQQFIPLKLIPPASFYTRLINSNMQNMPNIRPRDLAIDLTP